MNDVLCFKPEEAIRRIMRRTGEPLERVAGFVDEHLRYLEMIGVAKVRTRAEIEADRRRYDRYMPSQDFVETWQDAVAFISETTGLPESAAASMYAEEVAYNAFVGIESPESYLDVREWADERGAQTTGFASAKIVYVPNAHSATRAALPGDFEAILGAGRETKAGVPAPNPFDIRIEAPRSGEGEGGEVVVSLLLLTVLDMLERVQHPVVDVTRPVALSYWADIDEARSDATGAGIRLEEVDGADAWRFTLPPDVLP